MSSTRTRLLLIDDDVHVRRSIRAYFEDMEYDILEAGTGRQGLDLFRKEHPDVVLLDLRMPEMGGLQLLSMFREIDPEIPVIIVSGTGVMQDAISALRLGATDFVTKPIMDFTLLGHCVDHALEGARLKRENKRYREQLEKLVQERTSELEEARRSLEDHNLFLETLLESLPTPVYYKDTKGRYLGCNQRFREFTGLPRDQIVGRKAEDVLPLELCTVIRRQEEQEQATAEDNPGVLRRIHSFDVHVHIQDGEPLDLHMSLGPYRDAHGNPQGVVGVLFDVSEQKRAERLLEKQAFEDALTGLPNRAFFMNRLDAAFQTMLRDTENTFSVLYLDIDRFKVVVDSQGHYVGDQLLIQIADRLRESARPSETLARLGGDEFAVLVDSSSKEAAAHDGLRVARRLLRVFREPFRFEDHEYFLSASAGIVTASTDYTSPEEILRDADIAMYRAKQDSHVNFRVYDQAMHDEARRVLTLETEMRRALKSEKQAREMGFTVYYQPIVRIVDGYLMGFEALARWIHPEQGFIGPDIFIPMAEETGAIHDLGRLVLNQSLTDLGRWIGLGCCKDEPEEKDIFVSVNISGKQAMRTLFPGEVSSALSSSGLPASNLKLEITESVLMEDMATMGAILSGLKALGVAMCLDDFGTGYSSLAHLHRFPLDVIKIDRAFVNRLSANGAVDEKAKSMVDAILAMSNSLGLDVVAEGIETEGQAALLDSMGCRYAQGYHYARPMPATDIFSQLQRHGRNWSRQTAST
ncbi:putative bifunctional diguanylate cyclase/phosphodiesterase [Oceanidesulfovibrio indonesiensis]|nr:EAL domain-containing protein [Oceanidesulfovibrio indonesiensis]